MKLKHSRGRLIENPVGAVVKCQYQGREILGDVVGCYYREFGGSGYRLNVRYFNQQPWPFDPDTYQVDVIPRPHERQE